MSEQIWTIFCREAGDASGTTWIDSVTAPDAKTAAKFGRDKCAADWEYSPDSVTVIGVARGAVEIVAWCDPVDGAHDAIELAP